MLVENVNFIKYVKNLKNIVYEIEEILKKLKKNDDLTDTLEKSLFLRKNCILIKVLKISKKKKQLIK